jgi:hypothetical protein
LQNAGTGEESQVYLGEGNQYGKFADAFNVGKVNPHQLVFADTDNPDPKPVQKITVNFESIGVSNSVSNRYVDPVTGEETADQEREMIAMPKLKLQNKSLCGLGVLFVLWCVENWFCHVSDRSCLESKLMEAHDSTRRRGFVKSDSSMFKLRSWRYKVLTRPVAIIVCALRAINSDALWSEDSTQRSEEFPRSWEQK